MFESSFILVIEVRPENSSGSSESLFLLRVRSSSKGREPISGPNTGMSLRWMSSLVKDVSFEMIGLTSAEKKSTLHRHRAVMQAHKHISREKFQIRTIETEREREREREEGRVVEI
jgi:hypothetical protein